MSNFTYKIERLSSYFGRTTARVEWRVVRSDGRSMGTFPTRRAAQAEKAMNEALDAKEQQK